MYLVELISLRVCFAEQHFDALVKNNALDEHLARRIEAFRTVASASS